MKHRGNILQMDLGGLLVGHQCGVLQGRVAKNSTEGEGDVSIRVMQAYLLDCKPFSLHCTCPPTSSTMPAIHFNLFNLGGYQYTQGSN